MSKALIDVGREEITLSDNANKSTYKIKSEMFKYEEAQRVKMEYECRVVMMTDTTNPKGSKEGEDCSNPSIFVINIVPPARKKGKPNPPKVTPQGKPKGKKKKGPSHHDPEVYVITTAKGKYKWWRKMGTKLIQFAVFSIRVVDPPS